MLVVLRLSLGCHFLYEGVWKIEHRREFTAEPFLSQAKGPVAQFFYAMLPDIDGRQRLALSKDENGDDEIQGQSWLNAWDTLRQKVIDRYKLADEQKERVDQIRESYKHLLAAYLKEHRAEIVGYFDSLARFDEAENNRLHGVGNDSAYLRQRQWDRQQDLRKEVHDWLAEIDAMGDSYGQELYGVLDVDQKARGPIPPDWNPLHWGRMEQINFAVTYGLAAIGLCLMLGFCTRLAALGGAAFMVFVILTQPAWPTIYPPAPPVVGHALWVNKDFIEMVALVLLSTTAAGRWGGLDTFLYHWLGRPVKRYFSQAV
jgi:uncharacterized membrane protein YphA (DoxX/SURF4 family)